MLENYVVRCSSAVGWAMAGIYLARLPPISGMVATWKQERAARFNTRTDAANAVLHLNRRFSGTTWEAVHV